LDPYFGVGVINLSEANAIPGKSSDFEFAATKVLPETTGLPNFGE
jgi:hypothetical protein